MGHYSEADESAISLIVWVENFAFGKGAKKSTEKLHFLQVAKGRVVQKYNSIFEETTALDEISKSIKISFTLDLGPQKLDHEYSKLVLHIDHIFSYAIPKCIHFPVCDIKFVIWLLSKAQHNMHNNLIIPNHIVGLDLV